MIALIIVLSVVLLLAVLFVLSVKGEKSKDTEYFKGFKYAHRGLHNNIDTPENSMLAFSKALDEGYGIELDVHLLKDGALVVFHDASLERMAGKDVVIETLTLKDLREYRLLGTAEQIPTFDEVLELVDKRVPLLIELKSNNNVAELCLAINERLNRYSGKYTVQSFDPRCLRWFKKNSPEKVRGQIAENFVKNKKVKAPLILKFIMSLLLFNFLAKPNYVSYRFEHRNFIAPKLAKNLWKTDSFVWTIRTKADAETAQKEDFTIIFENFNA